MRKLAYDLIISDFDGTLASDDGKVSAKNLKAIEEYRENGGNFAISTGRLHYSILGRARDLGLKGFVSCCQGAVIADIESGERILDERLSFETTYEACKFLASADLNFLIYDSDGYFSLKDDEYYRVYESIVNERASVKGKREMLEFIKKNKFRSYKILVFVPPKNNEELFSRLTSLELKGCKITKSAEFLIEIVNPDHSKGTAVEFLAKKYGVDVKRTIAIGDQMNDISMIEKAGLGLAVKNASESLKLFATVLEKTNDENAVAEAIEKYAYVSVAGR